MLGLPLFSAKEHLRYLFWATKASHASDLLEAILGRSVFTSLTEKQDLKLWNWPAEIYQTLVDKFCVIEVI